MNIHTFNFRGWPSHENILTMKHFPNDDSSFCSHLEGKCRLVDGELLRSEIGVGHCHAQADEVVVGKMTVQNLILPQSKFVQTHP